MNKYIAYLTITESKPIQSVLFLSSDILIQISKDQRFEMEFGGKSESK